MNTTRNDDDYTNYKNITNETYQASEPSQQQHRAETGLLGNDERWGPF